jgi:hypothetical protein
VASSVRRDAGRRVENLPVTIRAATDARHAGARAASCVRGDVSSTVPSSSEMSTCSRVELILVPRTSTEPDLSPAAGAPEEGGVPQGHAHRAGDEDGEHGLAELRGDPSGPRPATGEASTVIAGMWSRVLEVGQKLVSPKPALRAWSAESTRLWSVTLTMVSTSSSRDGEAVDEVVVLTLVALCASTAVSARTSAAGPA